MPGAPSLAPPKGPPIAAPGQRREREKVRGRWRGAEGQTKSFRHCEETHTSLCFHLSAWWTIILTTWLRKKNTFFYATFWGVMEINCSHKTPSNMVQLTSFNTWDLGWLEGITTVYWRSSTSVSLEHSSLELLIPFRWMWTFQARFCNWINPKEIIKCSVVQFLLFT